MNPKLSLQAQMKLDYFGYIRRTNSLENKITLEKAEEKRRG